MTVEILFEILNSSSRQQRSQEALHSCAFTPVPLIIYAKDCSGRVVGSLVSATYKGVARIDSIWLENPESTLSVGIELIRKMEIEVLARGCDFVFAEETTNESRFLFLENRYIEKALGGTFLTEFRGFVKKLSRVAFYSRSF